MYSNSDRDESLGKLEDVYRISLLFKISCWVGGGLSFVVGIGILVVYNKWPPSPQAGIGPVTAYTVAAACGFGGLAVLIAVMFFSKLHYEAYEDGAIRIDRKREELRFQDVVVYRDTVNGIQFDLRNGDRPFWSLGPIRDPYGFRKLIRRKVCAAMWPSVKAKVMLGESIDFEEVAIDRDGITYRNHVLPWGEVTRVFMLISQGTLCIHGNAGLFCQLAIDGIPNHFLIEKIIGAIRPELLDECPQGTLG